MQSHTTETSGLSVIIAGGRDYKFTAEDRAWLDTLPIAEVVSGGAPGADAEGEQWAAARGIQVKRFPANWQKYGRAAGPKRNTAMADYSQAVVLFPGGRGTADMRKQAQDRGLVIFDQTAGPLGGSPPQGGGNAD